MNKNRGNGNWLEKQNDHVFNRIIYAGVIVVCISFAYTLLMIIFLIGLLQILIGMVCMASGVLIFAVGLLGFACCGWRRNLLWDPNYLIKEME